MSEPPDTDAPCPTPPGLDALHRRLAIACTDTGQSRPVADILLAWWCARACGGFDLAASWSVAPPIHDDRLIVLGLVARHREFPDADGLGDSFAAQVARWRTGVAQAHR